MNAARHLSVRRGFWVRYQMFTELEHGRSLYRYGLADGSVAHVVCTEVSPVTQISRAEMFAAEAVDAGRAPAPDGWTATRSTECDAMHVWRAAQGYMSRFLRDYACSFAIATPSRYYLYGTLGAVIVCGIGNVHGSLAYVTTHAPRTTSRFDLHPSANTSYELEEQARSAAVDVATGLLRTTFCWES
jgi:hypothetical protein